MSVLDYLNWLKNGVNTVAPFVPGGRIYYTVANGDPMPDNSLQDVNALAKAYAAEHAKNLANGRKPKVSPALPQVPTMPPGVAADMSWQNVDNRSANLPGMEQGLQRLGQARMDQGVNFTPLPTQPMPPVQGLDLPQVPQVAQASPTPTYAPPDPNRGHMTVPVPQPRPAAADQGAPSSGGMGFFQRNAALMRDPSTGDFLDPVAAHQANISGPGLVQKFMNLLHQETS